MAIHRPITFIVKHISLSFFFAVSGKTPYTISLVANKLGKNMLAFAEDLSYSQGD